MFKALIFGGTTEGRELAVFCAENAISADISVTTELGAQLLPKKSSVKILVGRLDHEGIKSLISQGEYTLIVDATHPFAQNATENIRAACLDLNREYYRVIRENSDEIFGEYAENTDELITLLNRTDKRILSTLGSKELQALTQISDYENRVFLRVLNDRKIIEHCQKLGFKSSQIISGRGPFSEEENVAHIRQSGAEILVTKDSGKTGGYPEKIAAAKRCKIELITLKRPEESGISLSEIQKIMLEKR